MECANDRGRIPPLEGNLPLLKQGVLQLNGRPHATVVAGVAEANRVGVDAVLGSWSSWTKSVATSAKRVDRRQVVVARVSERRFHSLALVATVLFNTL